MELPGNATVEYCYDDYHNVTTAKTGKGLVYNFEYDKYGNNTSVSIEYDGKKLISRAAYSDDGNRLVSTTDTAGRKTYYDYDANTNVLLSVKRPEDTASTKTSYSYDDMQRLTLVKATLDSENEMSVNYTYKQSAPTDDDTYAVGQLTNVDTATTKYSFDYGHFGLRNAIKIGSRTLADYSYTDENNFLEKLAYGNGDSVRYSYDKQGKVTAQFYEDRDAVTYTYDNNGSLAQVEDSSSGIATKYYYDFTDRLMKYAEEGSGQSSHSVQYAYDVSDNLTKVTETFDGTKRATSYSYDEDNRITRTSQGNTAEAYTYDAYGRLESAKLQHNDVTITDEYAYLNPTHTSVATTSMQVGGTENHCQRKQQRLYLRIRQERQYHLRQRRHLHYQVHLRFRRPAASGGQPEGREDLGVDV